MTAEATVNTLITAQNDRASTLTESLIAAAAAAQLAAIQGTFLVTPPDIPEPDDIAFPATNPFLIDQTGEYEQAYGNQLNNFLSRFNTGLSGFLSSYFPEIAGCIRDYSDDWICDTILNGGTGIPANIEQQIWDRVRDRESIQAKQNIDNATHEWAGRGFTLPQGALVARVQAAQQDQIDKVSQAERDHAIKAMEIEIENIRFAVEQAVKLRLGAVAALVDYIKAYFLPQQAAMDYAKGVTDAHYRYYESMRAYYSAVVAFQGLIIDVRKANLSKAVTENQTFANLVASTTQSRAQAAAAAAAHLGRAAAGALGAINTLANLGHNTSASE